MGALGGLLHNTGDLKKNVKGQTLVKLIFQKSSGYVNQF